MNKIHMFKYPNRGIHEYYSWCGINLAQKQVRWTVITDRSPVYDFAYKKGTMWIHPIGVEAQPTCETCVLLYWKNENESTNP